MCALVTGVQTCALPIFRRARPGGHHRRVHGAVGGAHPPPHPLTVAPPPDRRMARIMTALSSVPTLIAPSIAEQGLDGRPRTYEVRTFGCQMHVHEPERLSGPLEGSGPVPAERAEKADFVVINT